MSVDSVRCLVTGSTGYLGGRLIPQLVENGHRVRAMARNPDKLGDVPWRADVEVARGDLNDVDSLTAAFDQIDVVYYLVHSMGTSKDFTAEEARGARNVVAAAARAGVRRVVYCSGLHPEGTRLSLHLASRTAVGDILIDSGIETIVLQAGVVIGSGSASFEMIRHLTDRLPVMTTPKWVHNKIQPIAVRDILYYLVAAATAPVPSSRTWDIGGPDVLEYGDMMRTYAEVAGLGKRHLIALPFLTPTIASLWIGMVTPIPPGLARPLIESLECDAVMRDHAIDTVIPRPPGGLTAYRKAVELALTRAAHGHPDATWASAQNAPAEPLPSDPDWAGEIVYEHLWAAATTAAPDQVAKAARDVPNVGRHSFPLAPRRRKELARWSADSDESDTSVRLRAQTRAPGQAWLQMDVVPGDKTGSRYQQRAVFFPRGLVGQLYWSVLKPVHSAALRALARDVIAAAESNPSAA